ncbi:O-antigen ligase [Mariprofundus ferrinatatus]|uniref:O-antigen ligase n=1 Tax=Mariprofundus ferrinatatus TaxID=1921087 RepID=A0A2K8LB03_9PROT|nr:O-antigen ligase family protein [Mariprofundus ferrinatatus]ATX81436.1 O-antigen ligase [Mariprofundus ferrinatatus]
MNRLLVTNGFLCIAGLTFPFSVAASNGALAFALAAGIVSGLWWQGAKECWSQHRSLTLVLCAYVSLLLLGLLWSEDIQWGGHIVGRHWFWMLLPVVIASLAEQKWRNYFLIALSAGLTLHLFYCVMQSFGYVHVTTVGSSADNATGHIGHIGFGFVYGVWAAWLIIAGWSSRGRLRGLFWILAAWSYVMIFAAQGRSGYLIAFLLTVAVIIKYLIRQGSWKQMVMLISALVVVIGTILSIGPAEERVIGTWKLIIGQEKEASGFWQKNAVKAADERLQMWEASLDIYLESPVLGVGTGGFPSALENLREKGRTLLRPTAHPHNQYLLALVRWGPAGVMMLVMLLYIWMREGWRADWRENSQASLVFLPALALAVHGFTSTSLEEHFSAILAVLLLGAGLSGLRGKSDAQG